MFKALRMKIATRHVDRKRARSRKNTTKRSSRIWAAIVRPFKSVWSWVRSIDLIGLVNITLLSAIIALFSMLIIDVVEFRRGQSLVVIAPAERRNVTTEVVRPTPPRRAPEIALPIVRDVRAPANVRITAARPEKCPAAERQTARVRNDMYGDVIIDSRGAATMLRTHTVINGNLYLQNMRKYVLPCGVTIKGNLFLRDVNMLQFCGDFTVTGNIYVSPKSSFGPIPRTARVGGQIVI